MSYSNNTQSETLMASRCHSGRGQQQLVFPQRYCSCAAAAAAIRERGLRRKDSTNNRGYSGHYQRPNKSRRMRSRRKLLACCLVMSPRLKFISCLAVVSNLMHIRCKTDAQVCGQLQSYEGLWYSCSISYAASLMGRSHWNFTVMF